MTMKNQLLTIQHVNRKRSCGGRKMMNQRNLTTNRKFNMYSTSQVTYISMVTRKKLLEQPLHH